MHRGIAVVALLLGAGCRLPWPTEPTGPTIVVGNTNINNNGVPNPNPSPSPTACDPARLDLGVAGDDVGIRPGETNTLVLTVYGQQGVELPQVCKNTLSPSWPPPTGNCVVSGAGFQASITVPAGAGLGTCAVKATLANLESNVVSLNITPSAGVIDREPIPVPTPSPEPVG